MFNIMLMIVCCQRVVIRDIMQF